MKLRIALLLSTIFFLIGLATLPHYGINWDTINHLPRGQAYLRYLTSGKKDYSDLPVLYQDWFKKNQWIYQDPDSLAIKTNLPEGQIVERSYYQNDGLDFNYFMKYDGAGHPPLSDILSAGFNRILYAKLHLINDIDSYRVYGLLLAALLVGLVYYWTAKSFGSTSGFIAALSLATYPLFWSESHFNNEKDIPEAFYWTLFMFAFWKAITTKRLRWFLVSAFAAGFALGTKFNILFSVFVIIPWLFVYFLLRSKPHLFILSYLKLLKMWIGLLSIPLLMCFIFVISWPYLWPDPLSRVDSVIGFYKLLGTTNTPMDGYMTLLGVNSFPLQWIIFTTPPIILLLGIVGIVKVITTFKSDQTKLGLLILLWFLVPILRVIWPGSNTYGGVRQLMEYIPALAMLCGIGFNLIWTLAKKYHSYFLIPITFAIVTFGFLVTIKNMYTIHPNENVYFNSFIGGLSGAKAKELPYWGFSFGSPYREAISWLNKNAEPGATLVFAYELIPNFPRLWLRPDIELNNALRSGYLANGEYAITLNFQGTNTRSYYDSYLDKYVRPVYTANVDGVPVVSIWKNSPEYQKVKVEEKSVQNLKYSSTSDGLLISLKEPINMWRLEVNYKQTACAPLSSGWVYISADNSNWSKMPGELPVEWRISKMGEQPKNGKFVEPFVGQKTQYIKLLLSPVNTCMRNVQSVKVISL